METALTTRTERPGPALSPRDELAAVLETLVNEQYEIADWLDTPPLDTRNRIEPTMAKLSEPEEPRPAENFGLPEWAARLLTKKQRAYLELNGNVVSPWSVFTWWQLRKMERNAIKQGRRDERAKARATKTCSDCGAKPGLPRSQ